MKKCKLFTIVILGTCFIGANAALSDTIKNAFNYIKEKAVSAKDSAKTGVKEGVKAGANEVVKETVKQTYATFILKPLFIKPLKKILGLDKGEKIQQTLQGIKARAEILVQLKNAGTKERKLIKARTNLAKLIAKYCKSDDTSKKK